VAEEQIDLRAARAFAYENPRPDVQELVPHSARRILDLGCSSGAVGSALKERAGATVIGVEYDPELAATARERIDQVVEGDLEELFADGPPEAIGTGFDCIVCADVLEHLRDPWSVLTAAVQTLDPSGTVVISLPNVRFWETFRELGLRGHWPRRSQGIFDRTHLRWFALADALDLLRSAGLEPDRVRPVHRLKPDDWQTEQRAKRLAIGPLAPFLTFQYVISATLPASQPG
jgi:2-polyprenyl-3-methyl-5-hydroxy-6-metoxy-1,4-benzoquinol methylase